MIHFSNNVSKEIQVNVYLVSSAPFGLIICNEGKTAKSSSTVRDYFVVILL